MGQHDAGNLPDLIGIQVWRDLERHRHDMSFALGQYRLLVFQGAQQGFELPAFLQGAQPRGVR